MSFAMKLSSSVVTASLAPSQVRMTPEIRRPDRAGGGPAEAHRGPAEDAGHVGADRDADAGRGDRAEDQLTLTTDVDQAGAGRHRDRERGQRDRDGPQHGLLQRVRIEQGRLHHRVIDAEWTSALERHQHAEDGQRHHISADDRSHVPITGVRAATTVPASVRPERGRSTGASMTAVMLLRRARARSSGDRDSAGRRRPRRRSR